MDSSRSRPSTRGRIRSGTISTIPDSTPSSLTASSATTVRALAPQGISIPFRNSPNDAPFKPSGSHSNAGHSRTVSSTGLLQSTSPPPPARAGFTGTSLKSSPFTERMTAMKPLSLAGPRQDGLIDVTPSTSHNVPLQQRSTPSTPNLSDSRRSPLAPNSAVALTSGGPDDSPSNNAFRCTLNIHMTNAFEGLQAVIDHRKLDWAEVGDIVRVRPVQDPTTNTARNPPEAGAEEMQRSSSRRSAKYVGAKQAKRRIKGDYLFRIEENNEEALKKMNAWSGLSLVESVQQVFGFVNRQSVEISKVDPASVEADFIELNFSGQYLGRADMWRLGMYLEGKCVHIREKIEFSAGLVRAEVKALHIKGKQVMSALVTSRTKTIFRSKSAQTFIFLQLCREMYEFDEDGERYYEKGLYGFLPELFTRWKETQANHVVTFILFARVYYSEDDVEHLHHLGATGTDALRHDNHLGYYKDFYKIIVDAELRAEWHSLLSRLKREVMETHADILLNHHLEEDESKEAKIIGRLSFAHEGNILESLNIVLNPFDESYIDRDLSRTGLSMIMVTPGTGHFAVNKHLLRLTTERILEHGICLDLVNLTQIPLHSVPVFSFWSKPPVPRPEDARGKADAGGLDPLFYDDSCSPKDQQEKIYYSLAFWVYCSFYSKSHDKPFRVDRFIPRCKMYEVQMLGMLDHDLTEVSIPMLDLNTKLESTQAEFPTSPPTPGLSEKRHAAMSAYDADLFGDSKLPGNRWAGGTPGLSSRGSASSLKGNSGTQLYSTSYQSGRLPTFREASDPDSRSSSYTDREHGLSLRIGRPVDRMTSSDMHEVSEDISTPIGRGTPSAVSTPAATATPVKVGSPSELTLAAKSPATPHNLTKKASKASLSSKGSAPRSWFLRFTSRAAPSQPIAAVESIQRQDVSFAGSPAAPALATKAIAASNTSSPVIAAAKASPVSMAARASPVPPVILSPTAPQGGSIDPATSQPITITQRGKTSEPPRRRRRTETRDTTTEVQSSNAVAGHSRRLSADLPPSLPHMSSGSWRANMTSPGHQSNAYEVNPCRPFTRKIDRTDQSRHWKHGIPKQTFQHEIKWDSMCAPACLPLTNEYLPSEWQLNTQYELSTHEVDVDVSFLLRPGLVQDLPLAVLREMASQRLSQNFQFITTPRFRSAAAKNPAPLLHSEWRRMHLRQGGASDVLKENGNPLYLSTHNYVHALTPMQLSNTIGVECFTRKITYKTDAINYDCLIWPKQRKGYHHTQTTFRFPDLANRKAFSYLDRLITGKVETFTDDLRYWRTRFILIPSEKEPPTITGPKGEPLKKDEIHILGASKVLEMIAKQRWKNPNAETQLPPPKLLPTWLDPSACILDEGLMAQLEQVHTRPKLEPVATQAKISDTPLSKIAEMMRDPKSGLRIGDLWWQRMQYPDSFTGEAFVDWLQRSFADLPNRDAALEWGARLQERGLIEHCVGNHGFLDGHYFYRLREEFSNRRGPKRAQRWFPKGFLGEAPKDAQPDNLAVSYKAANGNPFGLTPPSEHNMGGRQKKKRKIVMSQTMIIDLDIRNRKSDRAEGAVLHSDIIHNPANGFHFELNWLGVSVGLLDETRQRWGREADKYGLRLVEAPVEQIKDIGRKYAYRSCYPIKLELAPPAVADLDLRLPEAIRTAYFFEYAILTQKFGFVLDVEANTRYPDDVIVEYSYRKAVFDHSQFVHKSGLALVQCLGGTDGFLWSHNRLFFSAQTRSSTANSSNDSYLAAHDRAERMCYELEEFCRDRKALAEFYESIIPPMPFDSAPEELEGVNAEQEDTHHAAEQEIKGPDLVME